MHVKHLHSDSDSDSDTDIAGYDAKGNLKLLCKIKLLVYVPVTV